MNRPTFITDLSYKQWVNDIERRFRSQQIKAIVQVNSCKIEFYWSIGRDICEMNVEQRYGDGVIKTLSQDLRMKIPEVKGLTPGGLYYCKRFYLLYNKVFEIFPQLGEKSVPQDFSGVPEVNNLLSIFIAFEVDRKDGERPSFTELLESMHKLELLFKKV